ncbi:hypothetical protein AVEN_115405-1 [Araneus ventricosus]|uniref:Uncharacterized protein n=1 Tax=Araneus ventricosus TaxID=182803 RepID=A0A4Y1ZYD1_ARAVE|nr:hypothetical protein AVEN_115405-1 [Araneus ventricosus]
MEWKSVVFSDESRLCLVASDGRVLVRRRPGERLQPTCLQPGHTGSTPGIMVWSSISYDSRSTLMVIPRTLTANLYFSLVIPPVVLQLMNSIQGVFSKRITLALIPLLLPNMLYRVSTCYLGLLDHQIFLQLSTYGT